MSLWKIKIGPRLVEAELMAAEEFHRQADTAFRTQLSALETEYQSRPSAYWNKSSELGITRGEKLVERRNGIDGLLDLNEYFGVIAVHAAFDHFLFRIFQYAKSQGLIKCRYYADKRKRFLKFSQYVDMLKDEFAIDLRRSPDWNRIEKLTTVRNAIAHKGGWIDPDPTSKESRKFKAYRFPSTWPLELPRGYFLQSKTLVFDTCRAMARKFVKCVQQGSPRALP